MQTVTWKIPELTQLPSKRFSPMHTRGFLPTNMGITFEVVQLASGGEIVLIKEERHIDCL